MVSKLGLVGGLGFDLPLYNLFPIFYFKVNGGLYLVCAGMWPHVREGVKGMIFILNPNPTSLSF